MKNAKCKMQNEKLKNEDLEVVLLLAWAANCDIAMEKADEGMN